MPGPTPSTATTFLPLLEVELMFGVLLLLVLVVGGGCVGGWVCVMNTGGTGVLVPLSRAQRSADTSRL